jgi:hypothetical protein
LKPFFSIVSPTSIVMSKPEPSLDSVSGPSNTSVSSGPMLSANVSLMLLGFAFGGWRGGGLGRRGMRGAIAAAAFT